MWHFKVCLHVYIYVGHVIVKIIFSKPAIENEEPNLKNQPTIASSDIPAEGLDSIQKNKRKKKEKIKPEIDDPLLNQPSTSSTLTEAELNLVMQNSLENTNHEINDPFSQKELEEIGMFD